MSRNIITKEDVRPLPEGPAAFGEAVGETPVQPTSPDSYFDRLTKYVPVEIIGAYMIIEGIIKTLLKETELSWALLGLLLLGAVGAWFFAYRILQVLRWQQLAMTVFAFAVWVFSIGGWFGTFPFWAPGWGTIAVVIFGVMVQIVQLGPLPKPGVPNNQPIPG
jgi:hypothetical protein